MIKCLQLIHLNSYILTDKVVNDPRSNVTSVFLGKGTLLQPLLYLGNGIVDG